MKSLVAAIGVLLGCSSLCQAQLTISNPQHLDVPEQRARVVWTMTFRVVARELRLRDVSTAEFPAVLVLGVKDEHYTEDEHGVFTIYLDRWNETRFAFAAMRLAVQRLVAREIGNKMLREIVKRSDQIAPVTAKELQGSESALRASPSQGGVKDWTFFDPYASVRDMRRNAAPTKGRKAAPTKED